MDGRTLLKEKDETLLRILERSSHYQDLKREEQRRLSAAHLHLASAKVVLGPQRLSSDAFDFRMQSQVSPSLLGEWSPGPKAFVNNASSLLRQRMPLRKSVDTESNSTETVKDGRPRVDPLRWFGGLPPQALRSAQKDFQQGAFLSLYVQCTRLILFLK